MEYRQDDVFDNPKLQIVQQYYLIE